MWSTDTLIGSGHATLGSMGCQQSRHVSSSLVLILRLVDPRDGRACVCWQCETWPLRIGQHSPPTLDGEGECWVLNEDVLTLLPFRMCDQVARHDLTSPQDAARVGVSVQA